MIEITRSFGFDAGHRILGHESKCANLHGHRYTAEVTVTADELDQLGRVIDFSRVKELVGGWIDDKWDHNMILKDGDPLLQLDTNLALWAIAEVFGPKQPYIMSCNPTAENMARELFYRAGELLKPERITVVQVKLWETPNCFAVYRP